MSEDKTPTFTPTQIAEMSQYYEMKARSYEKFLGCAIVIVTILSCLQVVVLAVATGYIFGRG